MERARSAAWVAAICIGLAGCGGGSDGVAKFDANPDKEDVAVHADAPSSSFRNIKIPDPNSLPQANRTNYLLFGYHVIANEYVESNQVPKNPIVDAELLKSDFTTVDASKVWIETFVSNKASDLFSERTVSVDVAYKGVLFSGGMETDFALKQRLTQNSRLVKYTQYQQRYEQYLTQGTKNLPYIKSVLAQSFKNRLAQLAAGTDTAEQIFRDYGTHLITDYFLGGRTELNFHYNSTASVTEEAFQASVNAAYKVYSGAATAAEKETAKQVMEHSAMTFAAIGGSGISGTTPEEISQQYPVWVASLDTNPNIVALPNLDSLVPLWNLTDDPLAKQALVDEFNKQMQSRNSTLEGYNPAKYITDIVVVYDNDSAAALAKLPPEYTKVLLNPGTDGTEVLEANKNAKGAYIYIGYKYGDDRTKAIHDIRVRNDADDSNLPDTYDEGGWNFAHRRTYHVIRVDLNKNARGDYIYLYYSRAKDDDTKFLSAIKGRYEDTSGSGSLPDGWQWTPDQVDLNKNAGGKYIYLAFNQRTI